MTHSSFRSISKLLIVAMLAVPFQTVQAGLIGTEQIAAVQQVQGNRARVADFLSRAEVQGQLQSLGVSSVAAQERVAAMTDAEVAQIAGKIDSLPAGAISTWGAVALIALAVWLFYTYK